MNAPVLFTAPKGVVYPESDGLPMADNSVQFRWIQVLYGNIAALFRDAAEVYVAGNMFWYPREGHPEVRVAPDVMVVFGRPKGDRGSYRQWEEGNVPVTVAFEVLSPGNTVPEMADKQAFYDEHGVEEYYVHDPDSNRLLIYRRQGQTLARVFPAGPYVSPRLGIRFDTSGPGLVVSLPNGRPFLTFEELEAILAGAQEKVDLARRLAELSRKARRQQASPEELAELERLEESLGG